MRSLISLLSSLLLLVQFTSFTNGQSPSDSKENLLRSDYVSLAGQALSKGNQIETDGNIHKFDSPLLCIMRTKSKSPKGTILLLPGGNYEILKLKNEGFTMARFLNTESFDVAILEYHIASGSQTRNLALADAIKAFRFLKTNSKALDLCGNRFVIMGLSSGGHLAARAIQRIDEKEQPGDLILISPAYLYETIPGTVTPAIMPPVQPSSRLFCTFSAYDNSTLIKSCEEYAKTWKGYDGLSTFKLLTDSSFVSDKDFNPVDSNLKLPGLLKAFLEENRKYTDSGLNPAAVPVAGYASKRHDEKLALLSKEKFELIMIGNSITHNFDKPEYQPVWNQFFAPRKALNFGFSGFRTENILSNIQTGDLDGQSPKVIVLEIGTNNIDEKSFPTRHTAGQLAGGMEAIVSLLRDKFPDTKIIVLRCFPGCYAGPNPTSHRAILERASDIVSKFADGKHVFYCDVNHVFLNIDGSIKQELMPDWLHPNPAGAKAWAQAMEPLLSELMGDKSLDTDISTNTAVVPVSKLEYDSYNWWNRHSDVLRIKDSINPEIVLIGNSITHFWGGEPHVKYADGRLRNPNGPKSWDSVFGNYRVLNLGFGWDRTQNVLWRLDHGELDGLHPRFVIINIGTNNTSQTKNARMNTAKEIVEGINSICSRVRSKVPGAKIILMAIFPREQRPIHPRRILINEINQKLKIFAAEKKITFIDIGSKMVAPDGTLSKDIASDFCHPTEKGYQIWADTISNIVNELPGKY